MPKQKAGVPPAFSYTKKRDTLVLYASIVLLDGVDF